MKKPFWKRGQKIAFARAAGVSRSYFSDVIHKRKSVGLKRALAFEALSVKITYKKIGWKHWYNETTKHPAFNEKY